MLLSADEDEDQTGDYEDIIVEEIVESAEDESFVGDEEFLDNIRASMEDVFRERKAKQANGEAADIVSPLHSPRRHLSKLTETDEQGYLEVSFARSFSESIYSYQSVLSNEDDTDDDERQRHSMNLNRVVTQLGESQSTFLEVEESSHASVHSEYEEQVIEKWFGRNEEPCAEDLETACRSLIGIVYKGEDVDPETMIRRTPPLELYRYLHQHYLYKKEVKQEEIEETAEVSKPNQRSLEDLFKDRRVIADTSKSAPGSAENRQESPKVDDNGITSGEDRGANGSDANTEGVSNGNESQFHESVLEIEETYHEEDDFEEEEVVDDIQPEYQDVELDDSNASNDIGACESIRDEKEPIHGETLDADHGGTVASGLSMRQDNTLQLEAAGESYSQFHESIIEVEETLHEEDYEEEEVGSVQSGHDSGEEYVVEEEIVDEDDILEIGVEFVDSGES